MSTGIVPGVLNQQAGGGAGGALGGAAAGAGLGAFGGPLGAGIGALVGGGLGLAGGFLDDRAASRERRRLRDATNQAEGQTGAQVFDILNSPEITAQRNFLRGLFGEEAFGSISGQGPAGGLFSGGTNIGGDVFFDSGGGRRGLGGGAIKRGKRLGRQLSRGVEAQGLLESGVNARGSALNARQRSRLEQQVARGQQAGTALGAQGNLRTGAARAIRKRGIGLDEASQFVQGDTPQTLSSTPGGFAGGQLDPFTANIDRQLQLTLAQSGFNTSLGGAAARALGTGLAKTQLQASLLPQLSGLAQLGDNLREQFLPTNLNLAVGRSGLSTGFAQNPFGAGLQGLLGGIGSGFNIGNSFPS